MLQEIIVIVVVLLAVFLAVRQIWRSAKRKGPTCSAGCEHCLFKDNLNACADKREALRLKGIDVTKVSKAKKNPKSKGSENNKI